MLKVFPKNKQKLKFQRKNKTAKTIFEVMFAFKIIQLFKCVLKMFIQVCSGFLFHILCSFPLDHITIYYFQELR